MSADDFLDEEESSVYYKVKVIDCGEEKYVFNKRTLVKDADSAKIFYTLRSIRRCMTLANIKEYEIEKFHR